MEEMEEEEPTVLSVIRVISVHMKKKNKIVESVIRKNIKRVNME
jgi:hypothetical protein